METETIVGGFGYNGWTNYATWRVNMELCDTIGTDLEEEKRTFDDIDELKDYIKEYCEEIVCSPDELAESIASQYALAFLELVDWREIAEHIADDYEVINHRND